MKDERSKAKKAPESRIDGRVPHNDNAVPGINTPGIELPAFNPPVPNRAWTAMREGKDIDELSPEEKNALYLGRDNIT